MEAGAGIGRWLLAAGAAAGLLCSGHAVAATPSGFYGITPATNLSEEEFARMGAGDVGTLRVPFHWEDIQPHSPEEFDYSKSDRVVGLAAHNGMRVLPVVQGVPSWLGSRSDPPWPPLDARGREAWSRLLGALADRYGPAGSFWESSLLDPAPPKIPITAWQIWNEPSDTSYWYPIERGPRGYAKLLRISDRVLARHDPAAEVIAAGLWENPKGGIPMPKFLTRFYRVRGVEKSFDAAALHPYAGSVKRVVSQIKDAREVMKEAGDRRKPIWITELGWPTAHEVGGAGFVVSEREQKRLLKATYERLLDHRNEWEIERLVWYTWRDNDLFPTCNICRTSGLFRRNGTPKPAWHAFVEFTGGSPDAPPPGPLPPVP
jgi:Glycosyl hydrolase catalytic core